MGKVYETPNKDWMIFERNDPTWQELFGTEPYYLICKRSEKNTESKYVLPELRNYKIVHFETRLDQCFKWLKRNNLISTDEKKYQTGLLCPETS